MNSQNTGVAEWAGIWLPTLVSSFLLCFVATSQAAAVYLNDRDEPVVGYLVRQDARHVVIEEVRPDGSRRSTTFDRTGVDEIVHTVSEERLGSLHYREPDRYREYAEELAEQRKDPEARESAMRLFLIAAYLDPQNLGKSAMLGLIDLARDKDEETRFRAMAYLLDADHDPRTLKPRDQLQAAPTVVNKKSRDLLIEAVKSLRQGRRAKARRIVDQPGVREQLDQFHNVLTYEEFTAACLQERLSAVMLRKLLLLELALQPQTTAGNTPSGNRRSTSSWREAIRHNGREPVPALSLETMTDFNPRQCHYREGNWIRPSDLPPRS